MRARLHVPTNGAAHDPGNGGLGLQKESEDRLGREDELGMEGESEDRFGANSEATGPERAAVHVDPRDLLASDAPAYPRPADTADELRADTDVEYTVERHHERHRAAVADWRERVRESFVDETVIETPRGEQAVDVVVLG